MFILKFKIAKMKRRRKKNNIDCFVILMNFFLFRLTICCKLLQGLQGPTWDRGKAADLRLESYRFDSHMS